MPEKNKILYRYLYFSIPLALMITLNSGIYSLVENYISRREAKVAITALLGLTLTALLIWITGLLAQKAFIPKPRIGNLKGLLVGLFIGLVISCSSAYFFTLTNGINLNSQAFEQQLPFSAAYSVAPAAVEETVFRFGIVHATSILTHPIYGLLAGSLPFGFGHLLNRLAGQSVTFEQVLGITLAGLLLSLLYLKYGLSAAIGCHYVWNSLASPWIKSMGLNGNQGISTFEGAWTTSLVLGTAILFILAFTHLSSKGKFFCKPNT